jgi:hypothetical protein
MMGDEPIFVAAKKLDVLQHHTQHQAGERKDGRRRRAAS